MVDNSGLLSKKRIVLIRNIFLVVFCALVGVLVYRMIYKGEEYQKMAIEQQTYDSRISAKRGTIYDRNGKALAVSASVEMVSVDPTVIKEKETGEKTASELSRVLNLEYKDVYDKVTQNSKYVIIARQIEKETADKVRDLELPGVNVTEDTKRYYPYGAFASQVVGFTGSDNQGLDGIELEYDEQLKGVPGRIVSASSANGTEVAYKYEQYIDAQDGYDVYLTIDEVIQHYVEKYLEKAYTEHNLAGGAAAIVVDPSTCEVLAMASIPDYDLNKPFELTEDLEEELEDLAKAEKYTDEEYNTKNSELLFKMWRNKAVSDTYEPGSTFKLATASAALESGSAELTDKFNCNGMFRIATEEIGCWKTAGHGMQTFVDAVCNSCNPAFIQIGQKIGTEKFYDYTSLFGFMNRTGIELPGEASGVFHNREGFNIVQLATTSFGQSFQVTPVQLVTFLSAIANGGTLYKPYVVKEVVDKDGNVISTTQPVPIRKIMSKETSETMLNIMKRAVEQGAATNGYIAGYRVGGKTGTSEKIPRGNEKYIASFVAVAPVDDPKIAVMVMLDEPNSFSYYGNAIAAPVGRDIINDTLQYLGVEPQYSADENVVSEISVPSIAGMSLENAKTAVVEAGFDFRIIGDGERVEKQVPSANSMAVDGSIIVMYTTGSSEQNIIVPNVMGMTPAQAQYALNLTGLNHSFSDIAPNLQNVVTATSQSPEAGEEVAIGTTVTVNFIQDSAD